MDKKYYIIIGVVIVLWAGFFAYRIHKNKNDMATHHKSTYDRLLAQSKTIPQAGLAQMVDALNKYRKKNKTYPATLEMLYPDFMPSQAFIRDLNWTYEQKGADFVLTKTIVRDNERMVASINGKKNLTMGTSVMVAAKTPGTQVEIKMSPSSSVVVKGAPMTVTGEIKMDIPSSGSPLLAPGKAMVDIREPEALQPSLPPPPSQVDEPDESQTPWETVEAPEEDMAKRISRSYLVWKDEKTGVMGFGNVAFPDSNKITLCQGGECFTRKILASAPDEESGSGAKKDSPQKAPEADLIAQRLSNRYLVWKDEQGRLGFGNITFPEEKVFRFEAQTKNWKLITN